MLNSGLVLAIYFVAQILAACAVMLYQYLTLGTIPGEIDAPLYGTALLCLNLVLVAVLPLTRLLSLFFRIIDPVSIDQQGEDVGHQYRTGIYWADEADAPVVDVALAALEQQVGQPLAVEHGPLRCFYPAEEYHQRYLDKNPGGYCHVPWEAIRAVSSVDLDSL